MRSGICARYPRTRQDGFLDHSLATDDTHAAERFRAIPQVETVTCSESQITIRGRGDDQVTKEIQYLSENRIRVTDFRTILPSLEDVLLKLTGHSIRD